MKTLHIIHPDLADEVRKTGKIVDSWQVFIGKTRLAKSDSRVVYGSSRGKVNSILYDWAQKNT